MFYPITFCFPRDLSINHYSFTYIFKHFHFTRSSPLVLPTPQISLLLSFELFILKAIFLTHCLHFITFSPFPANHHICHLPYSHSLLHTVFQGSSFISDFTAIEFPKAKSNGHSSVLSSTSAPVNILTLSLCKVQCLSHSYFLSLFSEPFFFGHALNDTPLQGSVFYSSVSLLWENSLGILTHTYESNFYLHAGNSPIYSSGSELFSLNPRSIYLSSSNIFTWTLSYKSQGSVNSFQQYRSMIRF